MRKNDKGMALMFVLLVSLMLLVLIFLAFTIGSNNILFMANYRDKTQALYAAEAGIRDAIYGLEDNLDSSGRFDGTICNGKAGYEVEIDNQLRSSGTATILSEGWAGRIEGSQKIKRWRRRLQVTVQVAAGSFNSLSGDGPIFLNGLVVINGIQSIKNPKDIPGNIHTNYIANNSITYDIGNPDVQITGVASACGTINQKLIPEEEHRKDNASSQNVSFDSDELDKLKKEVEDRGKLIRKEEKQNVVISRDSYTNGDLNITGELKFQSNSKEKPVLYVKGNLTVDGAVYGEGCIIVDGKTEFRGYSKIVAGDSSNLVVYSAGDITVAHPEAVKDENGNFSSDQNGVADFFAKMPPNALKKISQALPLDAPKDESFFTWYKNSANTDWTGISSLKAEKEWLDELRENSGLAEAVVNFLSNY